MFSSIRKNAARRDKPIASHPPQQQRRSSTHNEVANLIPSNNSQSIIAPWLDLETPGYLSPTQEPPKPAHPTASMPEILPTVPSEEVHITLLLGYHTPYCRYLLPRAFSIPVKLLRRSRTLCEYADKALEGNLDLDLVRLPDIDPETFEMWYEYVMWHRITLPRCKGLAGFSDKGWTWQACWPLINAYIMSTIIEDDVFGQYVWRLLKTNHERGQILDVETVRHIFLSSSEPIEELVDLIINDAIDSGSISFENHLTVRLPTSFIELTLDRVEDRIKWVAERAERAYKLEDKVAKEHGESHLASDEAIVRKMNSLYKVRYLLKGVKGSRETEYIREGLAEDGIEATDWTESRHAIAEVKMRKARRRKLQAEERKKKH